MANGCKWEMRQEIFNTRMSKCHLELKDTQRVMECNFICSVACTWSTSNRERTNTLTIYILYPIYHMNPYASANMFRVNTCKYGIHTALTYMQQNAVANSASTPTHPLAPAIWMPLWDVQQQLGSGVNLWGDARGSLTCGAAAEWPKSDESILLGAGPAVSAAGSGTFWDYGAMEQIQYQ